jgi:ubiquitin-like 1-activating enzyme E1 A
LGELSPVNAILGGVIGQEVIKAISKKNEPIDNFFVFDGNQMSGEVIKI